MRWGETEASALMVWDSLSEEVVFEQSERVRIKRWRKSISDQGYNK